MQAKYETKRGTLIEYDSKTDTMRVTPQIIAHTIVFEGKEFLEIVERIKRDIEREKRK